MVDVDALVDGLWGEELPAAPRNALHHHIARLRAALGEESIVGSSDGYALKGGVLVDAVRFEELLAETRSALREGDVPAAADAVASALALWRGSALQGLTSTAWFSAEARRLETLRVDALEEDFEVRLALGEHRELAPALRSALGDNPFRERLWGQLMLALYRSGRQADALETFQEARRVLADELGLEPGPELRRLQEAILAHDPAIAAVPVDRRRRGNLPAPSTSFVGREDELAQVSGLLHEHRLVTLSGPPGVGKSRLAVETARSLEHECPDGIWLVDFARAGSSDDAVRLLAHAADVRGSDPLARVTSRLRAAEALVVLDACEHVLEEAGRIASTLLAECPQVRILATSREALHVASEVRLPVAPLGIAAVELFLERAGAARPGFEADDEASALAAEIVRRVDGLPLAIELAAARVNVLGLAELVSLLERRAALLRDSPASDPNRTALQELVEWSYDLLHGDEKTLLQQLAVHRGGASLASLAAVAATHDLNEATVTYLVSALVDKSIVSTSFVGGAARYDMLDTVREYVLERLADSGGLAAARGAHAQYFAALADEARVELRGPEWLRWQSRLELENDNLWAALAYALDVRDGAVAVRLGTLGWYFALADRISEGRRFIDRTLSVTTDDAPVELRIEQLADLCYLATEELDLSGALTAGEGAVSLAATAAPPWQLRVRAPDARARRRTGRRRRTRGHDGARRGRRVRGGRRRLGHRVEQSHPCDRRGTRRRGLDRRRDGGGSAPSLGCDRLRRVPRARAAARGMGRGATAGARERGRGIRSRARARRSRRVRRPRGVRPCRARDERARARRSERGRGAPAAGARRRRGRRSAVGRGPRTCAARAHRGGLRRCRPRRAALPPGARLVAAGATAPGAREPLPRPCRQPGHGRAARARGDLRARLSWQNHHRAWQSIGSGAHEPSSVREQKERLDMSTTTIDDQLDEIRRRIDRLRGRAQTRAPRVWRHLDALQQAEAAVRAALRAEASDEVEEKLAQLKTRLDIAEHSVDADASDDWATFAAAVEAELQSWDTYLERLQTSVAAKAWKTREQAEATIGEVRSRRIAVGERLAQTRNSAGTSSQTARKRVTAARNELDKTAAELSTKLR